MNPHISIEENFILIKYQGTISLENILYVITEVEKIENQLVEKIHRLHDMRQSDNTDIDYDKMNVIANQRKHNLKKIQGTKAAFVVTGQLHFGLSRMYQALMSDVDHSVGVFFSIEDATKWLAS